VEKRNSMYKLVLTFLTILMLTGCWDKEEIDQRAYVLGIGLDQGDNEGEFQLTYLISNPEVGSTQQGGGTDEPSHEIITFDAASFIQSQNIANAVIAKPITYDILDLFVVSEEFAKSKDFIRWMYDATKDREVRRDTKLIVTKEKASEFIEKNKPKLETRRHEYFEILLENANLIGLIPNSELHNFFRVTEADADLFITAFATSERNDNTLEKNKDSELLAGKLKVKGDTNPSQFLGSAVFKEGQMIGTLTVEETRLVQLVNVMMEKPSFLASFQDPFIEDYDITVRYTQLKDPAVKADVTGKTPKIQVNLPLQVEVLTDHSMVNYAKHKEKRDKLKEYIKERIEESFMEFVKKTQEEFKGQPFGFSIAARKHFLTIQQWEQYDWMKSYLDAEVNLNVEIKFGEFGRQSELPEYEKVRD
jgi:spore germination protein KC